MDLEEGDLVLCTVEKIEKTVVFVKIPFDGKEIDGSIITSEIAPGRIRNIRDYVVPKKKIVCKVLRISHGKNIELSFRRVTPKERKEVIEEEKKEKSYVSILKSVLGEQAGKIIDEVSKKEKLTNFLEDAKQNPKVLEKTVGKNEAEKILEILGMQKEKKALLKREIVLKSISPNGLEIIKNVLGVVKNAEIKYISAGKYIIQAESGSMKDSDRIIKKAEDEVEKAAKAFGAEVNVIGR